MQALNRTDGFLVLLWGFDAQERINEYGASPQPYLDYIANFKPCRHVLRLAMQVEKHRVGYSIRSYYEDRRGAAVTFENILDVFGAHKRFCHIQPLADRHLPHGMPYVLAKERRLPGSKHLLIDLRDLPELVSLVEGVKLV